MKKETIIGIVLAIMTVWVIGFTAPKIYQIYKDKNVTETVKSDTIILKDTLFLERTAIDTLPKTVYQIWATLISLFNDTLVMETNFNNSLWLSFRRISASSLSMVFSHL